MQQLYRDGFSRPLSIKYNNSIGAVFPARVRYRGDRAGKNRPCISSATAFTYLFNKFGECEGQSR
jgi:hypothetical protein